MNKRIAAAGLMCVATWAAPTWVAPTFAADIPLYDTGPSEDSSFLRFVNVTGEKIDVVAAGSGAKQSLSPEKPATAYFPVKAKTEIKGTLVADDANSPVAVSVAPGEFATVFAVAQEPTGVEAVIVREQPEDFNALRVSLAFYNMDANCQDAGLQVAGRSTMLFEKVPHETLARRLINPVKLSVQMVCAGTPAGNPIELGDLTAGQRYSVFGVPAGEAPRLFVVSDDLS